MPAEIAAALAQAADRLGVFGQHVYSYAELPSTNDVAAALAERGAPEGAIVIAGAQTAGRGRQGRSWCSPPGAGLYVSVVLRPRAHAVPFLTLAAGVALADGIRAATGLQTTLKWPNDVMVLDAARLTGGSTMEGRARKLAGILTEASHEGFVVLGFGINVLTAAYPPPVEARATSLEGELGRAVDSGRLLAECLAWLATRYDDVQSGRAAAVLDVWRACARPLLGRRIEWDGSEGVVRGVASDVDGSGALLVRTHDGVTRVVGGEVRWI